MKELIQGHLTKADHNLQFVKSTLDLKDFYDWAIVSTYYAIYHASIALAALRGYATKDHNATLLILIREFYKNGLDKDDINTFGNMSIAKSDVLYYVEARYQRQRASYSTALIFSKPETELLRLKANFIC